MYAGNSEGVTVYKIIIHCYIYSRLLRVSSNLYYRMAPNFRGANFRGLAFHKFLCVYYIRQMIIITNT